MIAEAVDDSKKPMGCLRCQVRQEEERKEGKNNIQYQPIRLKRENCLSGKAEQQIGDITADFKGSQ